MYSNALGCIGYGLFMFLNVWLFYLARLLTGIAVGVTTVVVPLFISEYSPVKYRGSLGSFFQLISCLSTLAIFAMGFLLPYSTEEEKILEDEVWRSLFLTPVGVAFI